MGATGKPYLFSSASTPNDDGGFGLYHDLYPVASDIARTGERFHAQARAHQLSRMIVIDRRVSGISHARGAHHVRRDGFDHVVLQLVVAGRWIGGVPGDERVVRPGEVILMDMARPHRNSAGAARLVTISLPRDQIEDVVPLKPAMHAAVLPASASQLLGDFMLLLRRRAGGASPEMAVSAGKAVAELAAGAFANLGGQQSAAYGETHFTQLRRERAELFIETRLANADLDADLVAHGLGVSRTVLYQLFRPSGGVARYILTQRLKRLGDALRQRSETRSVSQLAFIYGFASESHCSRAFRAAYGMPPGQYRKEAVREKLVPSDYIGAAPSALHTWHTALR